MEEDFKIKSYCHIKNHSIYKDGKLIFKDSNQGFPGFARNAYRNFDISYPKFFKMDNLSKLAFLASEIILRNEPEDEKENIALVFSNRSSSLDTDRKHQQSIQNQEEYFPSPAVFVYTLPNICMGEISIRHKLFSENSFFIFARFNAELLRLYANGLMQEGKADKVLGGWIDVEADSHEAFLYLVDKQGKIDHTTDQLNRLYTLL